jgi:hypothetical protein
MRCAVALVLTSVALLALPSGARGDTPRFTQVSAVLKVHGLYYNAPNVGGFADAVGFAVAGAGAELGVRGSRWGVYVAGGLGWGGHEFTDVAGSTERTRVRAQVVRAGLDRHVAVGDVDLYGGPAVFWSRSYRGHASPFEAFHELSPYTFYGFEARAGGVAPIGPRWLGAYGEFALLVGRGRIEDDHHSIGTIAAWSTSPAFRGGLVIQP